MAILGKNSHFLTQILTKHFFCRLCPRAFLVIPICRNIFLKAQFFKGFFLKMGKRSIQFYSLAKELCSSEYWFLEKPLGNSSDAYFIKPVSNAEELVEKSKWRIRTRWNIKIKKWWEEILENPAEDALGSLVKTVGENRNWRLSLRMLIPLILLILTTFNTWDM